MNEHETSLVDSFLNSKKEYIAQRGDELIKALISMELEKKQIDHDIKLLKLEYREDGVDVALISKVFNKIKSRLRTKQEMIDAEDILEEQLMNNNDIISEIKYLIKPIPMDQE
jgi:uncharacterized protein (UPF0335 family)